MKLLVGNGYKIEVYDLGDLVMRIEQKPAGPPIKFHGRYVVNDDKAREMLKELMATGWYSWESFSK